MGCTKYTNASIRNHPHRERVREFTRVRCISTHKFTDTQFIKKAKGHQKHNAHIDRQAHKRTHAHTNRRTIIDKKFLTNLVGKESLTHFLAFISSTIPNSETNYYFACAYTCLAFIHFFFSIGKWSMVDMTMKEAQKKDRITHTTAFNVIRMTCFFFHENVSAYFRAQFEFNSMSFIVGKFVLVI